MYKLGTMYFRKEDMAIVGYAPSFLDSQEFISANNTPAFALGYLDEKNRYRQLTSFDCESISVTEEENEHTRSLTGIFTNPGGKDIILTLKAEWVKGNGHLEPAKSPSPRGMSRM